MRPLDAFWHLLNFFLPALWVGALGAAGAKGLWRRELAGVTWLRLATTAAGAGSLALLAGLLMTGRDGRMLAYGLLVLSAALALWWVGFAPRRR